MDIYVARQPVFTVDKTIFGYELLFRQGLENAFPDIDGDTATSNVLSNTFFTFEIKEILGDKPGLVNFTRQLILQSAPLLFSREHIIIEILENIEPEPDVIMAMAAFKEKGFTIALDDFVFDEKFEPMLDLSAMIKFDLIATPLETLTPVIKEIQKKRPHIVLLAEKVETYEEFKLAQKMGFTLFQGYFFAKPEILTKKELSDNQATRLRLISEMGHPELDMETVESLIKKDVSVSFKLLKFINSAYFNRPSPINTVKDAITYLGIEELRKFIHIITVADLNDTKPNELVRSSLIRARMCELCGTVMKTGFATEELFTLGLFSHMDAMLDLPIEAIVGSVAFSENIKNAMRGHDKDFNKILSIVASFEQGDWQNRFYHIMAGLPIERKLPAFYLDAIKMVNSFFTALP